MTDNPILKRLLPYVLALCCALSCRADPFDDLRLKWRVLLVGGDRVDASIPEIHSRLAAIESSARGNWRTMQTAPDRAALWNGLSTTAASNELTIDWSRLRVMALAWATPGQKLFGDAALLAATRDGMSWMEQHRYNPGIATYGNWWDWEIGAPLAIDDLMVLLYDQLTPEEIAKYAAAIEAHVPDPRFSDVKATTTGANRVWKCRGAALRAIVVKDPAKLQLSSDALLPVFQYVTSGDGYYEDGSFIQHRRHPYNGGYGTALLSDVADLLYLLAGSKWDVRDPARANIDRWVFDSYEPLMYRGALMDMVRGREVSRAGATDHAIGHNIAASILRVSQFAPPEQARRMRSAVKYHFLNDSALKWSSGGSIEQLMAVHDLLADKSVPSRGDFSGSWVFGGMDRVAHQRASWAFGIAMHSTRIFNFESINIENLHGWHDGDGMTYLYTADLAQFSDGFWPTVDPQRLPGTTVIAGTTERQSQTGSSPIAGGASVDGYSSAMMLLSPGGVPLEAKKSWFLLDDAVVALGSGIRSKAAAAPVETIVENRMLHGKPVFASAPDGKWAFLENAAGYYFPNGAGWKTAEVERQGAWGEIENHASPTMLTRHYRTIWFDHGAQPGGASYSYALLPGRTREQVEAFAAAPGFRIVENSENAHAIAVPGAGIRAVNFWTDGEHSSNGISCDRIGSVMVIERGGVLSLGVADPTQLNTGSIHLTLDRAVSRVMEKDPSITVERLSPSLRIRIDVKDARGRTLKAKFVLG
jgi:hyaluronate lyase